MLGTAIGGYRLVSQLGEGGMGAVYLGEHLLLGRRAAIKVLLPALSARQDIVHRFFNEARAVTAIADPGIVQVFDFGYHGDGSAYLVMELLDGEPLDARLRRHGRLLPVDALRIARQLAASLGAAHARGIVHRDLKPENVFLVPDREVAGGERVKVLDFGIAKLTEEAPRGARTMAGVLMGTPVYMSPEQCRGAVELDHRSDVYALGCVLYHLLVGRPPFVGDSVGDIIAAHLRESAAAPSVLVPGLTPEIDAIVLRCLVKAPEGRFPSMVDVAAALGGVLQRLAPGPLSGAHAVPYLAGLTPAPVAGAPTTLGGSAVAVQQRSRRGGAAVGLAIAAIAAVAVAAALWPSAERAAPEPAVAIVADAPADAGVDAGAADATVDAGVDLPSAEPAAPIDAGARRAIRRAPADARCSRCDLDCDGIPEERVLTMNRLVCAIAAVAAIATPTVAAAQSSADAESLFREARALVKAGRVAEGCDAFESSQRIEPTVPTLLNLADCRERNQQLASAWGHFVAAAQQTRGDRAQAASLATAQRRAAALEPRLSYLVVAVPDDSRVDGLVVSRNGVALDPGMWNRSLPVDGGDYVIEGKAPGHEPWSTRVTVAVERDRRSVEVPRFKTLPALSPVAPPVAAAVEPDPEPDDEPDAEPRSRWTRTRWIAVGVGGAGVAALAAGAVLGIQSQSLEDDAFAACPEATCDRTTEAPGAEALRVRAEDRALAANIAYGVAAAAAIGAGVLWLIGGPDDTAETLTIAPTVGAVTGVALETRF